VGVAVAYFLMLVLTFHALRPDDIPMKAIVSAVWRPFAACLPMVGAVLGLRYALSSLGLPGPARLLLELSCGAGTYAAATFLIAPKITADLIDLGKSALRRRKQPAEPLAGESS